MNLETLELSTQVLIAEAIRRGVEIEILDAEDNFIALRRDDRTEYVKQATRTSADTYISALLMENKEVTKKVLRAAGMRVPAGGKYHTWEAALSDHSKYRERKVVVKPNSTNFGEGVAILEVMTQAMPAKKAEAAPKGALEVAGKMVTSPSDPVVDAYRRKLSMALF